MGTTRKTWFDDHLGIGRTKKTGGRHKGPKAVVTLERGWEGRGEVRDTGKEPRPKHPLFSKRGEGSRWGGKRVSEFEYDALLTVVRGRPKNRTEKQSLN